MSMSKPHFSRLLARRFAAFLAALLVLGAAAPAALAAIPDRPENQYVLDSAGVLSQDLEEEIIEENQRLFADCGAEVAVAAVDFFGGQDREDYANRLFNRWGIGSSERNNGILLVLAIGEEDYYATAGSGIEDYFDGAKLDDLLYDYLEPDFAKEDYDAGVKKFFRAVVDELDSYYAHTPAGGGSDYDNYSENDSDWENMDFYYTISRIVFAILRVVVVVVILLVVFSLIKRAGRGGRGPGPGSGGGGGGFWQGMFIGSALNRRRHRPYWGPPPPPPPPGGFGGFGGPGPRPPRPPRGGGMGGFGGFSSGGRSGGIGGAGRGTRSGGGFHSGGSSRGGGAGRRR